MVGLCLQTHRHQGVESTPLFHSWNAEGQACGHGHHWVCKAHGSGAVGGIARGGGGEGQVAESSAFAAIPSAKSTWL